MINTFTNKNMAKWWEASDMRSMSSKSDWVWGLYRFLEHIVIKTATTATIATTAATTTATTTATTATTTTATTEH